MTSHRSDDPFDLACVMKHETHKAILYNDGKTDFWIAKSLIASGDVQVMNNETGTITLTVPYWLAHDKGLV